MVDSPRRQQVFNPGELPLVLLALLDQEPKNGYELMEEMRRLFDGTYKPSAGGLYPAKTALAEEGLIRQVPGDNRNRYESTAEGRRVLGSRARALAEVETRTGIRITEASALDPVLARFSAKIRSLSGRIEIGTVERILDDAARRIERLNPPRQERSQR